MFLSYFLKYFVLILFRRKVEDLQFRIDKESITKGDLEVKPHQPSKASAGAVFRNMDITTVARTGSRGVAGIPTSGLWAMAEGLPALQPVTMHLSSGSWVKFSLPSFMLPDSKPCIEVTQVINLAVFPK